MVNEISNQDNYLNLNNLEIYLLSRKLSSLAWKVYDNFSQQEQIVVGSQFLRSTDSVGANIAEGYGRFHYLDKIKFYYNARASLKESRHWMELISERRMIEFKVKEEYLKIYSELSPKLNAFINKTYRMKNNQNNKS